MSRVVAQFIIPVEPRTKKNSNRIVINRRTGKPMIIASKAYEDFEARVRYYLDPMHISRPCNVKAIFYMKTRRKVDLPNLEEALDDTLVKWGVMKDDNRNYIYAHDGSRVLWDKDYPRIEITISEIPEDEFQRWK